MAAKSLFENKLARRLGYTAFGCLSFLAFLHMGFPTDALKGRVISEVARQTRGAVQLRVGRAALWRGTGIALEDVHVLRPGSAPFALDAVRVRLRVLPLLLLRRSVNVELPLGRGMLYSTLSRRGDGMDVHLEGQAIDFSQLPTLSRALGVPLAGVADFSCDVGAVQDAQHATGTLALELDHVAFGPGTVYGLALPRLEMGKINTNLKIDNGHAKITQFKQAGGTVRLMLQGGLELNAVLGRSALDACAKVQLDPVFLEKNPKLRSVMQLAEVQLKRDGDGFLNAPLVGQLGAPQLRPGLCPKR